MKEKTYLFLSETDFSNPNYTGAHRRFLELIKNISARRKTIVIVRNFPGELLNENITLYNITSPRRKGLPQHVDGIRAAVVELIKHKRDIQYDYAISFGPTTTIAYKLAGYRNVTSLFREDLIGYEEVLGASKWRKLYFSVQEKIAVKASTKIIVQCKNDKENLIKRNERFDRTLKDKVYIQINNVNASWMYAKGLELKEKKDEIIRILFIGDFSSKRKGHGILLPAIVKLLEAEVNIELYIAGSGLELEKYKEEYKRYQQIHFLGRVNNMEHYLAECDFEVVPSLIDSCPNTVLEGLNAGIAVYGANTGGIPDLLVENKYLFEPNVEDVYSFLHRVITEKSYVEDAINQKENRERLTFDWSGKIQDIIEN